MIRCVGKGCQANIKYHEGESKRPLIPRAEELQGQEPMRGLNVGVGCTLLWVHSTSVPRDGVGE